MRFLYTHQRWILALAAAILVLLVSNPLLHYLDQVTVQKHKTLETETARLEQNLQQLRADAETARRLGENMDETEAEEYLAVANRMHVAAILTALANTARFSKFTYSLSPEERFRPEGIESGDVARSTLTLQADAPSDEDAYQFIEQLQRQLAGRLQLQQLTITKLHEEPMPPLSAMNIRMTAQLEWLSNGSQRTARR